MMIYVKFTMYLPYRYDISTLTIPSQTVCAGASVDTQRGISQSFSGGTWGGRTKPGFEGKCPSGNSQYLANRHVYTHIYIYIHICIYIYICTFIYIYIHKSIYTYIYVYIHIYNVNLYTQLAIYTNIYIYIHMYTY